MFVHQKVQLRERQGKPEWECNFKMYKSDKGLIDRLEQEQIRNKSTI